ncbi:hypothetical protein BGW38_000943 [Lunasporangiospora selenospora]|uniref:Uncharacterized protein n=1 Tax=Lunasporangiospora selenospora TaxID=979761 RepID=A0A9P6FVC7_9FUNG|nr:hypothetical protein BGW38_000943 [Lunasporangiospora selenospora]
MLLKLCISYTLALLALLSVASACAQRCLDSNFQIQMDKSSECCKKLGAWKIQKDQKGACGITGADNVDNFLICCDAGAINVSAEGCNGNPSKPMRRRSLLESADTLFCRLSIS